MNKCVLHDFNAFFALFAFENLTLHLTLTQPTLISSVYKIESVAAAAARKFETNICEILQNQKTCKILFVKESKTRGISPKQQKSFKSKDFFAKLFKVWNYFEFYRPVMSVTSQSL